MQAVGKKLAVVEVCVGKGVARVRAGRRATGNQVTSQCPFSEHAPQSHT